MNDSACYYYILSGDDRLGPLEYEAVKTMAVEGQLTRDHYCWTEGLDEWQPIESVLPKLASFLPPQIPLSPQKSERNLTAKP